VTVFPKHCPFCGTSSRSFQPFGLSIPVLRDLKVVGAGIRDHALCPTCRSTDRERLEYLYLSRQTQLFSDAAASELRILHVAPEPHVESLLRELSLFQYTTCDLQRIDVDRTYDISNIPVADEVYDIVICNHVLEHVDDATRAISEIYRTLTWGGWAMLQVPISPVLPGTIEGSEIESAQDRALKFGQADHRRIFGEDYPSILESAGFSVDIFDWTRTRNQYGGIFNKYSLCRDEKIYIARRLLP